MSIAGAGETLVGLLNARLAETGGVGDFLVSLMSAREVKSDLTGRVGLILYRIDVDATRRHIDLPRLTPGAPSRFALGLELHYMLAVWGKASAVGEQVMLARCMEILDANAVVSGPLLSTAYTWDPGAALKVTIDTLSTEDLLRLWDTLDGAYQLSVPYLVRTVRLSPVTAADAPMVDARTLAFSEGVP